jgi:uncharacterized protein (DUF1697 family)
VPSVSDAISYAAFLRGMNVGGHRITNEELCATFAAIGFGEVRAFRASGNVVFTAAAEPPGELSARIEEGLAEALGYSVPTFLRTAEELRAIASAQPFAAELIEASGGKLQVAILSARPPAGPREQVLALGDERDRLAFGERELFWLPSGGFSDTELDLDAIEQAIGPTTWRTKGTIEQLTAKHLAR